MSTVEVSRSLLFSYGIGSLAAPLLLGIVMQEAHRYGFYVFFALSAAVLALVAWRQKTVPQAQRSVYVNIPGDAGPIIGDLDPRNNEGVMRPFDEAQAQAYADEWTQENPQDSDEKPG